MKKLTTHPQASLAARKLARLMLTTKYTPHTRKTADLAGKGSA